MADGNPYNLPTYTGPQINTPSAPPMPALPDINSLLANIQADKQPSVSAPPIPTLVDTIADVQTKLGRKLNPLEYVTLANNYKTDLTARLASQKGATNLSVTSNIKAFQNNVDNLQAQLYGANVDPNDPSTWPVTAGGQSNAPGYLKSFGLGALGGSEVSTSLVPLALGGILSGFGIDHNPASDAVFSQINPDRSAVAANIVKQLTSQRDRLLQTYPQDAAKIHAEMDGKIAEQASIAGSSNLMERGAANMAEGAQAHPLVTAAGAILPALATLLGTRNPVPVAAVASLYGLGNVESDSINQINQGQALSDVEKQNAVDAAANILMGVLPAGTSGTVVKRALKGAGVNTLLGGATGLADIIANPNNKSISGESIGLQAGLGAILGALHSGDAAAKTAAKIAGKNAGVKAVADDLGIKPETLSEAAAKATPIATPPDEKPALSMVFDNRPAAPLGDTDFQAAQDKVSASLTRTAKRNQPLYEALKTPEDIVIVAMNRAKRALGDTWDKLSSDQRLQVISDSANWIGTRAKLAEKVGQPETARPNAQELTNFIQAQRQAAANAVRATPEATATAAPATPEATAPEATAPEATAPEATAPEATAPEATATAAPATPEVTATATPAVKEVPLPNELVQANRTPEAAALHDVLVKSGEAPNDADSLVTGIQKSADDSALPQDAWLMKDGSIQVHPTDMGAPNDTAVKLTPTPIEPTAVREPTNDKLWRMVNTAPAAGDNDLVKIFKQARQAGVISNRADMDALTKRIAQQPTAQGKVDEFNKIKAEVAAKSAPKNKLKKSARVKKTNTSAVEQPKETTNKLATANKAKEAPGDQANDAKSSTAYLGALVNREKVTTDPVELALRKDPYFSAAADAMAQDKITSAKDLDLFLKQASGKDIFADEYNALPDQDKNTLVSKLTSGRSANPLAKRARGVAKMVRDSLISLGEDKATVDKMPLYKALQVLNRRVSDLPKETAGATGAKPVKVAKVNKLKTGIKTAKPENAGKAPKELRTRAVKSSPKSQAPEKADGAINKTADTDHSAFIGRFGDKLATDDLDALYSAVQEARMGDPDALDFVLKDLKGTGAITKGDRDYISGLTRKSIPKVASHTVQRDVIENNASGESSASLEAIHRTESEKAKGQTRAVIERSGRVYPLIGTDAVDVNAHQGQIIVQRGIGKDKWTVLSHGKDISDGQARGAVASAERKLDELHDNIGHSAQDDETVNEINLFRDVTDKKTELPIPESKTSPLHVGATVSKIIKSIQRGATTQEVGEQLVSLRDKIGARTLDNSFKRASAGLRRGNEWMRARLMRVIADLPKGDEQRDAMEFGLWALERNSALASGTAVSIRNLRDSAGTFNAAGRIISLSASDLSPRTVVHELMHSAERLLPRELQDKIHQEYIYRLINKIKQQREAGNTGAVEYLQKAMENVISPSEQTRREAMALMTKYKLPVNEFYKYFSPSEYFAEEASSIMHRNFKAGTWLDNLHNWFSDFSQHVKNIFGNNENHVQVLKALKEIGKSDGTLQSKTQIETRDEFGAPPTSEQLGYEVAKDQIPSELEDEPPPTNADTVNLAKAGRFQRFYEGYFKATFGLEKVNIAARALGIKLDISNNVDDAVYAARGFSGTFGHHDMAEVGQPAITWILKNARTFAPNAPEFMNRANTFFGYTNWIERMKVAHWLESPLKPAAEFDRADIRDDMRAGKLTPEQMRNKLIKLADKNATMAWQEWATKNGTPLNKIQERLDELDKQFNINQKTMQPLNDLLDGVRQRSLGRLEQAGMYSSKADPYIKLYGYKWYVPLKNSPYGTRDSGEFDVIPKKHLSLTYLNSAIKIANGRRTFASEPLNRLFIDMSRAANQAARAHVTETAYNLISDATEKLQDEINAATRGKNASDREKAIQLLHKKYKDVWGKITVFKGIPKDGYTRVDTGEHVNSIPHGTSSFTYHDGDTHYVMELRQDSHLFRGLAQMGNVKTLDPASNIANHVTNPLARLFTTAYPVWTTTTGMMRDFTFVPLTQAITLFKGPLDSAPYMARYTINALQAYRAAPTMWRMLTDDVVALNKAAKADPNSWAGLLKRFEDNGGRNLFTQGFAKEGVNKLLKQNLHEVNNVLDAGKWGVSKFMKYTGNYADMLEQLSRVADFKTQTEMGIPEKQAAINTRKLLDYSESGIYGRRINAWLAFYRVGATGVDSMRRALTKPDGKIDWVKAAKWQGFMGALGYAGYVMMQGLVGNEKLKKVSAFDLTSKLLFPIDGKIAGINLGLGFPQMLMAPGVLMAAVANNHITWKQAVDTYGETIARNSPIYSGGTVGSTPTDYVASILRGGIPTVAKPILDIAANTSSYGTPIHTNDPSRNMYNSDQGYANTPEEYKDMAKWLRKLSDNKIDYFPEDIRYMVRNYGGQLATLFVQSMFSDPNAQAGGHSEPLGNRLAGNFFVNTDHSLQNRMHTVLDQLRESTMRYNSIVDDAKADGMDAADAEQKAANIVSRDRKFSAKLEAFKVLEKASKDYNKQLKQIRADKTMSDLRKQLLRKRLDSDLRKATDEAGKVAQ